MADIATLGLRVDATGAIVTTDRFGASLDKLGQRSQSAEQSIAKLAARTLSMAAAMSALISAANAARAFADAMAEVSTLLGDTSEIDSMTASVRELSKAFGKDTVEEAKALYQIISAGASTAAAAMDTLTASNKLAIGGVTTVSTAADGLTSILNAYGASVGTATDVSDALFVAMRAGKTTIDELSNNIGKVAPLAATAGVALEDVLAATAALTKGGQSTNVSITGLRAILASILKPTSEAIEMANALGFEFNATGLKAKGLQGFLAELAEATGGNVETIAQLFTGVESLVPALALMGAGSKDYATILGDMGDKAGQTEVAFNKMAQSPGFKLDKLLATAKDEALGLGLSLLNVLSPAVVAATKHMQLLVEAALVVASIFAARFFATATADAAKFITQLMAQRVVLQQNAQATLATATAEVAVGAKRLAVAETQLRALIALGAANDRLAAAQARVNFETALGVEASAALAVAQTRAATATSGFAVAATTATSAASVMWKAIGGPIGATLIALFALYKLFIDNTKAVEAQGKAMQEAGERANTYASTLNGLADDAIAAAEAQERLNLATLAGQLEQAGGRVLERKQTALDLSDESGGAAILVAKEAAEAQRVYNQLLVDAAEATGRLNAVVAERGARERSAAEEAAQAALDAKKKKAELTQEYLEASKAMQLELEKQNALNAAFGRTKREIEDINAAYELRAKVMTITSKFTGEEAQRLIGLATALSQADAAQRRLVEAQEKALEQEKLAKAFNDDAERARQMRAKSEKEIADALREKQELRARGAQSTERDLELLQREIDMFGQSGDALRALRNEYMLADKQAEYLASGLDAVSAAIAAQEYVDKRNELDDLTASTIQWGEALASVNDALNLLVHSLSGGARDAARAIGAISGALQVLIKAQETAKKSAASNEQGTRRDMFVGAAGAGLAGFGAGAAFGSQTSSRAIGVLGGAATGAATGAAMGSVIPGLGTVIGGAIGGLAGAVGGFITSSKNATQEMLAMQSAQVALRESMAGLRASMSNDTLGSAIAQARVQFEKMRAEAEKAFAGRKNEAERNKMLAELNMLEAQRIAQLREEYNAQQQSLQTSARVRELQAKSFETEAAALAEQQRQQETINTLIKQGASDATIAAERAAQKAETERRLADEQKAAARKAEDERRRITDLSTGALSFTDPRAASDLQFAEAQAQRVFDAILEGVSEAELAAIRLYNAAELAAREAAKVENDRRVTESLLSRSMSATGDATGASDRAFAEGQRQEMVDAILEGMSPFNLALLAFTQFAERSQRAMQRAIEEGTAAINRAAANEIAAVDLQIEAVRSVSDGQIAAIDQQIEATRAQTKALVESLDAQILAIREQTKEQVDMLDAQLDVARKEVQRANDAARAAEQQASSLGRAASALQAFSDTLAGSQLAPETSLARSREVFDALAQRASAGDADAAANLPAAAQALLDASRAFNGQGAGFEADFETVRRAIDSNLEQFVSRERLAVRQMQSAQAQAESAATTVELLTSQRESIVESSQRSIEALTAIRETAIADADRTIEALVVSREQIARDAEASIATLQETRNAILTSAQAQIDQLILVEEAAHQARLEANAYWETFLAMQSGESPSGASVQKDAATARSAAQQTLTEQKATNANLQSLVEQQREELNTMRQQVVVATAAANASNTRLDAILVALERGNATARRGVEVAAVS
jgi:hypothetical protein